MRDLKKKTFINHLLSLPIMLHFILFFFLYNAKLSDVELLLDDDSITINLHGII